MEYKLTYHTQYSKTCKDGKHRNFLLEANKVAIREGETKTIILV